MKPICYRLFSVGLMLLLGGCNDKSPLGITAYSPTPPSGKPLILRSDLKSGGSYMPGYQSGNIRSDQVTLSWEPAPAGEFASYQIFRNDIRLATITEREAASYTDDQGIFPDSYYNYKIALFNPQGLFLADTIRIKTPAFSRPFALSSQVVAPTEDLIRIFWRNGAESATDFRIYRKLLSDPDTLYQMVGTASDTLFTDNNGIIPGNTYEYQVSAFNAFEATPRSLPLAVSAFYDLSPPFLTTAQQLDGSRMVRLFWIDFATAEDGYRIWRRSPSGQFTEINTVPTNAFTYTDSDTAGSLQLDSTYIYAVSAFGATGESELSNAIPVTILSSSSFAGYQEDFESPLGGEWELISSTPEGRIIRSTNGANSGQYMLQMDVAVDGVINLNEAILSLDLSTVNPGDDLFLRFFYNTFDDEVSPLEEYVDISSDGSSWLTVFTMPFSAFAWEQAEINLQDFTDAQPYSSTYRIRWHQGDNFSFPVDGIGIDDIEVSLAGQ